MRSFSLHPAPPFRLDLTVWALRRVPVNEMDRWDGHIYKRVLIVRDEPVQVSVGQNRPAETPELIVSVTGPGAAKVSEADITPVLTKILGLDIDLTGFYSLAQSDIRLSELVGRFVGFKPPRLGSIFEALVNGIACQQISLTVCTTLLNRLSAQYGIAVGDHHAFPRPEDLLDTLVEDVRQLGFSGRKAQNILAISQTIADGQLEVENLEKLDDDEVATALRDISGVGRWTAQYVELRGMGRLDVYPADDVGSQIKLQQWLNLNERPNYDGIHQLIDRWTPYRGLIYFHLLLDSQDRQGLFQM
ncbi:MAG: DNA-3-methyladenine glycosylase 2 family protein [Armatimonadetes bacterium]|nr:DNA-3-methyladenine glycosylase 2 family protein [Armatimonadota bacterium]